LSVKLIIAGKPEVQISSPATKGKDETAVAGTVLPFNVKGPELVTRPAGSAAMRAAAIITPISRNAYFMTSSRAIQFHVPLITPFLDQTTGFSYFLRSYNCPPHV
jgi:hypothetical protein